MPPGDRAMSALDHVHSLDITLSGPRRRRRHDPKRSVIGAFAVLALGGLLADVERQPAPSTLIVTPPLLAFGVQPVGTASVPQPATITNSGAAAIEIGDLTLANPASFS